MGSTQPLFQAIVWGGKLSHVYVLLLWWGRVGVGRKSERR